MAKKTAKTQVAAETATVVSETRTVTTTMDNGVVVETKYAARPVKAKPIGSVLDAIVNGTLIKPANKLAKEESKSLEAQEKRTKKVIAKTEPVEEPALRIIGILEAHKFTFIANQGKAAGYQHKDGRAVVVQVDNSWTLAQPNGKRTSGKGDYAGIGELADAVEKPVQKMPDTSKLKTGEKMYNCTSCGKLTRPVGDAAGVNLCEMCYEQGGDENAVLDGHMTQEAYDAKWTKKLGEAPAKVEKMLKAVELGAVGEPKPLPPNVVRAVEVLGGMTLQKFALEILHGDKNYKRRVTLLKTLLKTDKVLVKDSTLQKLMDAFYSAVGVGDAKSKADKQAAFIARCKKIASDARQAKGKAKREEKEMIQKALRATVAERTVPGTILPATKKKNAKERATELEEAKKALRKALVLQATLGPVAAPKPEAEVEIIATDLRLLEDPGNGIAFLQLERSNSQGAICVYNNGQRVSVGVIPTETLKKLRTVNLLSEVHKGISSNELILTAANQLLNPIEPSVPVTPVAVSHLTAVIHCKELKAMEAKTKKFAAPAATATEKPAKKAAAKAEKPAKKAAAKAESNGRGQRHDPDAKIKGIKPNPLREGTFCWAQIEAVNGSKTLGEAQEAILKNKKLNPAGRALEVGWLTKKGYLTVA